MTPKHLLTLSLCILAACGDSKPEPKPDPTPDPTPGCDAASLSVKLLAPSGPVTTRGTVQVSLAVTGKVDTVEVLRDGLVLATVAAPYSYTWDTTSVLEGTHEVQGRATCGTTRVTSDVQTVMVDRTPPAVTGRTPSPDAEVAAGSGIRVDFSESVLPSTVTSDSLMLKVDGFRVDATMSLSTDGRALTLTPTKPLAAPARAEVTLAAGLTDAVGNLVVPPSPWTFTVPRWLAAPGAVPPVQAGERFASQPILQLDATGQPVVAFLSASGPSTSAVTRTARWTGSAWTPLLESGASEALALGFAMGPQGRIMFASLHHPSSQRLDVDFHTPGKEPATDFIFDCVEPVTAVGPLGTGAVACAYALSGVPPYSLVVETFGSGAGAELSVLGAGEAEDQRLPALALDAEDRPVVAYLDKQKAFAVARWSGTAWSFLGTRLQTQGLSGEPIVRIDSAKQPVLAWREVEGSTSRVRIHRFVGSSWSQVVSPSGVALPPANAPSLAMTLDGNGQPVLAWTEAGTPAKVRVSRFDGSTWTSLGDVSRAGADVLLGRGGLELDAQGRPVLGTVVRAGGVSDVQVWRLNVP
ncbi:Ig-like domain-containing protein [Pyxidicoccus parkwayensis]|uniref:Ig-like domain-containing protein n=1 Tax=Pyxidicoccus parkwayensis TaxID=2813578 RepID=A0ABX7NUJ3_9BACT|nr:Ig-like domain-containing protein [Pyxidicoccus parkwaysis]QSQ22544.1 Ig-like domain-containing protein [Pyxidicoccus parkwaysis]